jgi:hypothetical protein
MMQRAVWDGPEALRLPGQGVLDGCESSDGFFIPN